MLHEAFTPHGHPLSWAPWLIWSSALSAITIAIAYYAISIAIVYLIKKRPDISHPKSLWLLVLFTLLCGTSHLLSAATFWPPLYYLDVGVNVATAIISVLIVIVFWPIMPTILSIPSQRELKKTKRSLDAAQRIAHIGSWWMESATNRVYWSEELYRMLGQDPSQPPPRLRRERLFVYPRKLGTA